MVNNNLKTKIIEVVENQIKLNEPSCTKPEFRRLVKLGFSEQKSKELIAAVLLEEMYYVMKDQIPFDEKQYEKKLSMLPNYKIKDK